MKELETLLEFYDKIVFFDTETTGLDPVKNEIIEIAALSYTTESCEVIDHFVKPDKLAALPPKIVELTGITDQMIKDEGITQEEAAELFAGFIRGQRVLLIAHNANFDLCFVRGWLRGKALPEKLDFLDTLTVYKDRRSYPHKLSNAVDNYGLSDKVQNTHRAIDDVWALAEVTKAMSAERDDLYKYINLFGYNSKYGYPPNTIRRVRYKAQSFHNAMTTTRTALYAVD